MELDTPAIPSSPPVSPQGEASAARQGGFFLHARLIGGLTFVSRIFGLLREIVAGHYLGTGLVASAFTVAFTIPNLFRKLFGEGALSAAFIPLYSQAITREDPARANQFAAAGVNLLGLLLLAITVIGEAIMLIWLWLDHSIRVDTALTIKLAMIMLPYVLLICMTAFLGGILQVHKRFAAPAVAPAILNIVHIGVVFFGAYLLGLRGRAAPGPAVVAKQTVLAYWLGFFVLAAGAIQLAILLPGLRAAGFRFRVVPHFWTPAVQRMIKLTIPVALGAGVLQLSVLLDKAISVAMMRAPDAATGRMVTHFSLFGHSIAYPMDLGAPARLNLAQFLYQFPLGVFAIALATAIFPSLSAHAVAGDRKAFKAAMRQGIGAALWEGLPASLGLMLVAGPAARLLFQHGQITAADADWIALSTRWYAGAIWAFSLLQIINRGYYAIHDMVTPVVMSVINIILNLAVELPLLWRLGEAAMAVGTLVSFSIQAVVMLYMLDRKVGGLGLSELIKPVAKMILAAAIMGAACIGYRHTPLYPKGDGRLVWTIQLLGLMACGAGVYLLSCGALGVGMMAGLRKRRT